MPKLMMIQPGAFGDIINCAPIAKAYHDAGHEVCWPVRSEFMDLIGRLDYVHPMVLDDDVLDGDWLRSDVIKCLRILEGGDFDYVLNLADRGPHPTAELPWETSQEAKYRLAALPFETLHTLEWTRNIEKEDALYSELVGDDDNYVLCGLQTSTGKIELPIKPNYRIIEMNRRDGYVIFDWYKVILQAKSIYSAESSFHCFIDGIIHDVKCPKYRLQRTPGKYWTVSKHWIDIYDMLDRYLLEGNLDA